MADKWARCNHDGKPISPGDQKVINTFKIWLEMDDTDHYWAIRLDPEWQKFTGITQEMVDKYDGTNKGH
jgi:hypothetical protein